MIKKEIFKIYLYIDTEESSWITEAEGHILYTQLVKWCSPAWEEPKFS